MLILDMGKDSGDVPYATRDSYSLTSLTEHSVFVENKEDKLRVTEKIPETVQEVFENQIYGPTAVARAYEDEFTDKYLLKKEDGMETLLGLEDGEAIYLLSDDDEEIHAMMSVIEGNSGYLVREVDSSVKQNFSKDIDVEVMDGEDAAELLEEVGDPLDDEKVENQLA